MSRENVEVVRRIQPGRRRRGGGCARYARRADMETEVAQRGASIWTMREGKIAQAAFYPNRMEALEAVGLQE